MLEQKDDCDVTLNLNTVNYDDFLRTCVFVLMRS